MPLLTDAEYLTVYSFFFQIDPITLSVLTETQSKAVDYVRMKSKKDSESVYTPLLKRVLQLGVH